MDDSVLWSVALGAGALGLLLLAVAVVVAICLNIRVHRTRGAASADGVQSHAGNVLSTDESQSYAEDLVSTDESQLHAGLSSAEHTTTRNFWVWVKAWIFAVAHAGTVSLVLGGITFFEDLVKASDEIQRTGTVTFPKQLLPGSLAGSVSRKRLARPSDDFGDLDQSDTPPPDTAGWEVVDLLEEADAGDDD